MAQVTDWIAQLVGGRKVRRAEVGLAKSIAPGTLESIRVETDHPRAPVIDVVLDPEKGHQAHVFTRMFGRTSMGGTGTPSTMGIPVIEITPDPAEPDRYVRLYLRPDGITVSTKDIYW